jgi:hypothetical protein
VSSEHSNEGQSLYVRLALLTFGWVTAGVLLYSLAAFLPAAMLAPIAVVAWAIVKLDRVSRKNKSLASLFCVITCSLTGVASVALWLHHQPEHVLIRLIFAGVCLAAGLIFLDRRADDWL